MSGLVTLGETMGLFRPVALGLGELSDEYRLGIGGAESNVAIGVSRLGQRATWVGRVGADAIGRRVLRTLRAEAVELSAVVDEGASTGVMVKESRMRGATTVMYARRGSAGSRLESRDLDENLIKQADILHVTGITPALSDSAADAVQRAVDLAVRFGVTVSFDVNHRSSLWRGRDPRPVYRSIAERADIVFAGREEAELIAGVEGDDQTVMDAIAQLGPSIVAVKRGEDGCIVRHPGGTLERDAIRVDVVDTVGAGDAFVAGFLAETLAGAGIDQRIDTAIAAGAFACLGPGDWESFPRRDEIALLRSEGDPVTR